MSLGAVGVSRFLQHALSSHPRPIYDTAFEFHRPGSHIPSFNAWNSFPSDHATAFGGLVIVVFLARPRLGLLAGVWFCVLELSRAYMGAHYPSDLVGGAALGASLVFLGQLAAAISCGKRVVLWERSSPALFYMVAFFVSYQIATLFQDFRYMMSGGLAGAVQLLHELVKLISHQ